MVLEKLHPLLESFVILGRIR